MPAKKVSFLKSVILLVTIVVTCLLNITSTFAGPANEPDDQQLSDLASRIQSSLNRKHYLLEALSELARRNPEISQSAFEDATREMFSGDSELLALELARDSIISHVYPLAGNQQVLGLNLTATPGQSAQVQKAITSRTATLAGPYALLQGGHGVILRQPIFLGADAERYWGLAILVIDWRRLSQQVGLNELEAEHQFALRNSAPDGTAIALGNQELFEDGTAAITSISLSNAEWQLALKTNPHHHTGDESALIINLLVAAGLLLIFLAIILRRYNHWLTPAALSIAFILLGIAGLKAYNDSDRNNRMLQSYDAANRIRQLIYQRLADNQSYLSLLAEEHSLGQLDLLQFSSRGGRFVADHPELKNLTRVGSDLVIEEVTPRQGNAQILGLTISLEAPRRAALLAKETRRAVYTDMFKNIQGMQSFETWYPVYKQNRFEGLIVAVYDVEKLLQAIIPPTLAQKYEVSIRHRDNKPAQPPRQRVQRQLTTPGHGLQLYLTPRNASHTNETSLLLLTTLGLALGIFLGIRALQRTNQRLSQRYKELSAAQVALMHEKERSQITLSSIADGVITLNNQGEILSLNATAQQQLGLQSNLAVGRPLTGILQLETDSPSADEAGAVEQLIEQTRSQRQYTQLQGYIDRQPRLHLQCSASRIEVCGKQEGIVVVLHDVSELTALASELDYRARHDALTGLINRSEFEQRCKAAAGNGQHALLYMDLDQFKLVNDTCGHLAGDHLLIQLTALLQKQIEPGDTLARLGGDEFGLLLTDCNTEQAQQRAEHIRKTVKAFRFVRDDKVFELGCSIGLVPLRAGIDYNATLARADMACYIAKDSGRNRIHTVTEFDQESSRRSGEMSWAARLNTALEQNRFLLFQQRIEPVSRDNQHSAFCEVLLRMRDEKGNLIPPGAFLPAAERYHLISTLDRRTVELALDFFESSPEALDALSMCSINLSGQSICDAAFTDFVSRRLRQSSLPNHKICFEITETAAIANLSKASDFIHRLQRQGIRFALDDFGTGMSSFGYLKQLPVDFLKIDGSFVRDIATDPHDRTFVEAINNIGHSMQMTTVAEFVEDEAALQVLQQIGVDYAQGYGIARPAPLQQLQAIIPAE
ncbi:EAL domain-containing protein [Marinobacterium jannaschii]|uniref:EAL domain-containing protein n=1 Tax=Marinobacterium jannaschii TaxID=64970 RepID=UPI0006865371|nr:EAL domain-containing protein [Marinobacterium jannaschii]